MLEIRLAKPLLPLNLLLPVVFVNDRILLSQNQKRNESGNEYVLQSSDLWKELSLKSHEVSKKLYRKTAKEKLVLVKEIIVRNRKPLLLKKLKVEWLGSRIEKLRGSLYATCKKTKKGKENLKATEENLLCDGKWDKEEQEFIFQPNEKLVAVNKLYIAVLFKSKVEDKIKRGRFAAPKIVLANPGK
jgi:hypothetical protein